MSIEDEATGIEELLAGKQLRRVIRNRPDEIVLEFDDGSRLFVNVSGERLECSVT